MEVAVVGTGYVGLVAGACFAELGHRVICVDKDPRKVALLESGGVPIYEPGLADIVAPNADAGRLTFTTDLRAAVTESQIIFIAVGTPPGEDGSADLSHVLAVADGIATASNGYKVVVVKSTVPIGTCRRVAELIESRTDQPFDVVSNPEFLRQGAAVRDFLEPDRIVVGADTERSAALMSQLFEPLTERGADFYLMDVRSSEMTKYAANSMLATRISFMNEMALLCDDVGADVEMVRRGIGSDRRIGPAFLRAGLGYGGSCFPKDIKALVREAERFDNPMHLVRSVEEVNERQKRHLVDLVQGELGRDLTGKRVAIWGLAFKPETDDMREAPSIIVVKALLEAGASVSAHDPEAASSAQVVFGDSVDYLDDPYEAARGADALVLITEWRVFANPDWERLKGIMADARVFDGRNFWDPEKVKGFGFRYRGIGRR